ncbi:MAG: adenylosuccinate synthase [Planctomycetota bacterium]|nr:adenylosuccinate synthase [Planctomycetota bacterium]
MSITCVFGAQWGDEGKGKVVDFLAGDADYVVRYQGGANAGHTIKIGEERFALRLTPSGVLQGATGVIANGVMLDPGVLREEIDLLENRGFPVRKRLWVSDRAHLVLPFHGPLDRALEQSRSERWRVGTTGRGISTAAGDKHLYEGFRVADLLSDRVRAERLVYLLERGDARLRAVGGEGIDVAAAAADVESWVDWIRPLACDTARLLHDAHSQGKHILLEGAQAALLDVDFGTYPFVSSSNTGVSGVPSGTGLPGRAVSRVVAVAKAYTTRVGTGPFPTKETDDVGRRLQQAGEEFGTVTGRPRQCGWFDAVSVRGVCRLNGVDAVALTKIDVLSGLDPLRICVAYEVDGRRLEEFPADVDLLSRCRPVYRDLPGFHEALSDVRDPAALPSHAAAYVRALEEEIQTPVELLSVGPERTETLKMGGAA